MAADFDVLIVGGGINGLTAAAYLARSGRSVLVVERSTVCGGSVAGTREFAGIDVAVSPFMADLSMPEPRICRDLGLDCAQTAGATGTFVSLPATAPGGVLLTGDAESDAAALERAGLGAGVGASAAAGSNDVRRIADARSALTRALAPSVTEPLLRRTEARSRLSPELWDAFIESPLANIVRLAVSDDTLRGALVAEALTADHTFADDPSLAQNRAFVAEAISQASRDRVPAGGGSELARSLTHAAVSAGALITNGGTVQRIQPMGEAPVRVTYRAAGETREVTAQRVLATVPPWTLDELLGDAHDAERPEGATAIATLLVGRLPHIPGVTPAELAFRGAFIANASAELLDDARRQYGEGFIPVKLPCIVRVPTLADPRLLPLELRNSGAHIMQVTALGLPYSLGERMPPDLFRERVQSGILRSLSAVFGENIDDLVRADELGQPCVRTWTSVDIESEFGYPGGHIHQNTMAWPFVDEHDTLDSPAERWGVNTRHVRVFQAGGSVRRAGAGAGLGGFAAAMAVFEADS